MTATVTENKTGTARINQTNINYVDHHLRMAAQSLQRARTRAEAMSGREGRIPSLIDQVCEDTLSSSSGIQTSLLNLATARHELKALFG